MKKHQQQVRHRFRDPARFLEEYCHMIILPYIIACDLNGVFGYFQRISCWFLGFLRAVAVGSFDHFGWQLIKPHSHVEVQEVNQTLLETQKMLQMNYAQEKVRYGRTLELFFSFGKSYVASFWFILSYCCVYIYILVWIHSIILGIPGGMPWFLDLC